MKSVHLCSILHCSKPIDIGLTEIIPVCDVLWSPRRLKSSETLMFAQQLVQAESNEFIKAPHYWQVQRDR